MMDSYTERKDTDNDNDNDNDNDTYEHVRLSVHHGSY